MSGCHASVYRTPAGRPVTYGRSVGNSYKAVFIERFLDELAAPAGVDRLGRSSALCGEITFAKGAAEQSIVHDDAVLRMRQAPQIAVKVLESGGPIRGVGETGVPPVARFTRTPASTLTVAATGQTAAIPAAPPSATGQHGLVQHQAD